MATSPSTQAQPRPEQHLMQMASGYMITAAVYNAAKLDVAGQLVQGPRPVSDLARVTGANEDALYRILRALSAVGIFAEPQPRTFALNPPAEALRQDAPNSMRDMLLWVCDPFHFRVWGDMEYSLRTGKPAIEHVTGKPCFEYFDSDPDEARVFNNAMTGFSANIVPTVLDAYDFSGIGTLVDIAGGHGAVLCEILNAYPKMKGVLFDLPSVIDGANCRLCDIGMQGRCATVSGSFFDSVPAGGDAYIMKHIIHDWDDVEALKILRNCHQALEGKPHGKLLLIEGLISSDPENVFPKLLDLEMLLFPGGRERTEEEFRQLLAKAGFRLTRVVHTKSRFVVLESEPAAHGEVVSWPQ